MRATCEKIVEGCGTWWTLIGWFLFASVLLLPLFASGDGNAALATIVALVFFIIWWNTDVVYQCVPLWIIGVGVAMIGIGVVGQKLILPIAAWVLYWMKVRE